MKKKVLAFALLLALVLSVLTGCGAGNKYDMAAPQTASDMAYSEEGVASGFYGGFADSKNEMAMESPAEAEYDYDASEAAFPDMVNNLTFGDNVKLIFRAWVRLQTLDFTQAEADLNRLVEQYNGYFEAVYTDNGSYYSNSSRMRGSYTVRVPAENYDRFLAAVGGTCHVVSMNKTTEDVGLEYSDTEMRLQTVKAKQERLLALLNQATDMSDIIQLEGAISDCQYQIDAMTTTLNRYDSLIGYSTVEVELEQVERLSGTITEEPTFWDKFVRDLKEGLEDFAYDVEALILWIAYHLLGILIVIGLILLYRKHRTKVGPLRLPHVHIGRRKEKAPEDFEASRDDKKGDGED